MDQKEKAGREVKTTTTKKSKGGFFNNLFKKKQAPVDSTATGNKPVGPVAPKETPKKRGGLFKKKSADPIDKKKEDGDGF
jgi:hypothetical protein